VTSDVDQYGGKTIGEKTPTADKKIMQSVLKNSESARTLSSLLGTQTNYMNEIKADPSKRTPRQDLSLVVAAVRAMNPGSVRLPQKELELEIGAGTWTDQAKRWYDKASTGLLPDDQRNDLFNIVQKETTTVGKNVVADWKQAFPNRPLPSHLKQFDTGDATGGTVNMTDEDILKKIDQLPK
jgi:hypothetical protein